MKTLPRIVLIAIFLAWLLPGLVGRDLWKADEPYSFGLVNHIIKSGDWVVPTLAGEPFMEKPPLYYLSAAAFARIFSPWMQLHDAARMATAFYMMLTLLFVGLTARELLGKEHSEITMLILLGCTGLQITGHKLITDVSLLTGFSLALYGLALCRRRPALGGVWIGMGTGIGFMSKGLLAPGLIGLIALAMPLLFAEWRNRRYFFSLFIALAAALPWLVIWPYALFHRSPDLFKEWFWLQNMGRFFGHRRWGERDVPGFYFFTLPWYALPALPLALWTLWHNRRSWRDRPALQLPLTAFLVMLTVLSVSSSARSIYGLPMLLPLTLLAATGTDSLPDKAKKAISRFSIAFFGMLFGLLWLGWIIIVTGRPSFAASKLNYLQPDYAHAFNVVLVVVACVYTVAWLIAVIRSARLPYHPVINWTAGAIVTWGLLMTLWLPWLDARSGYQSLFTSLKEAIPSPCGVIASQGVGESERAVLEYYAGIFTQRVEVNSNVGDADLLLIQSGGMPIDPPAGLLWRMVWEGRKLENNGKAKETYRLYQRAEARISPQPVSGTHIASASSGTTKRHLSSGPALPTPLPEKKAYHHG